MEYIKKTDKETGQHNLQSMNKNAECEEQLQEQLPKHWMQDVQERNRNTKHILEECPQIHWEHTLKTTESEIFNTDLLQTLREAIKKNISIIEQMDKATNKRKPNKPQANPHQRENTYLQTKNNTI